MTVRPTGSIALRRLWPAAALAALVACGSDTPSRPSHVPTTGTPTVSSLSGTVMDSVDRQAVEGARVVIVEGSEAGRTSVSNAEGKYDLGELPRGFLMVKAEKKGHGSVTARVFVAGQTVHSFFLPFRAPEGTFVLTGTVSEPERWPIDGARVTVVSGTGAGLSASTNRDGSYTLVGLQGEVTLRVEAERYTTRTERVVVDDDKQFNVELPFSVRPASLAGEYELTLEASPACTAIPEQFRRRTYSATVSQQGSHFDARLAGATFTSEPYLVGRVFGDEITFGTTGDWYYYGLEELIEPLLRLHMTFEARARVRQRRAEGPMSGIFTLQGPTVGVQSCDAADHRFSLVPK